jgi:hypothetical protein
MAKMDLPHQVMLEWALSDNEMIDTVITKEGEVLEIARRLSIKERIELLKGCAAFYAPTLKSIEAKAVVDLDSMDLDQLKAKLMTVMAKSINDERKNAH